MNFEIDNGLRGVQGKVAINNWCWQESEKATFLNELPQKSKVKHDHELKSKFKKFLFTQFDDHRALWTPYNALSLWASTPIPSSTRLLILPGTCAKLIGNLETLVSGADLNSGRSLAASVNKTNNHISSFFGERLLKAKIAAL